MLRKLDLLLNAFGEAGIIVSAKKSKLFEEAVNYLGFEVSKDGIGTVKAYTEAIRQIRMPETVTEMKFLIGKFSYHRRFIQGFAEAAAPLVESYTEAAKSNSSHIKPTKKLSTAVEELKEKTWELDTSTRNNLVFYGIVEEDGPGNVEWSVREVIRKMMQISREMPFVKVVRGTGETVRGSRPITVQFERYQVLGINKLWISD